MDKMRKSFEERQLAYGQECLEELKNTSLKDVTPEQAVVILIPSHGPENFYCDGELSHAQGLTRWKGQLANSGLTPLQVQQAVKYIFG